MNWIPETDPPPETDNYLVTIEFPDGSRDVRTSRYYKALRAWAEEQLTTRTYRVIAWMPQPLPFTGQVR